MRVTLNSNCEREFILQSFIENYRIDARKCDEYRPLKITLGIQRGSCFAELGNTKVFVQVSAELVTPKQGRPCSGLLYINVEMSPMAAPNFEAGRLGERGVEISRLIERILKEANCVDVESLCVIASQKVWQIRVDIHVIDHDGAIVDCASVAVICALKSFRRPDVTITGESYVVHRTDDKEPVPLNLFHIPVCVTYGITEEGKCITVDPSEREELVLDGEIVVAMNSHKEVCAIHCTGGNLLQKSQILRCVSMAAQRTIFINSLIKQVFEEDFLARLKKTKVGFSTLVSQRKATYSSFTPTIPVLTVKNDAKQQDLKKLAETQNDCGDAAFSALEKLRRKGKTTERITIDENAVDNDEASIIEEILDLEPANQPTKHLTAITNESVEDMVEEAEGVTVIETVSTKTKRKKRERTQKKDDDIVQLLMDIEQQDTAASTKSQNSKVTDEDELQIVGEFKAKHSSKQRRNKQWLPHS